MSENRVPAGVPTGGQFATSARNESGVSLGAHEPETIEVTIRGRWGAEEIPPGCRKPRFVTHDAEAVAHIRSVTAEEAPVGLVVRQGSSTDGLRVFDGDLYDLYRPASGQNEPTRPGDPGFRLVRDVGPVAKSAADFDAFAETFLNHYLVVDGEVWRRCGEPRYVVQTFGFGGNHGGTGLLLTDHDNENISAGSYFRADDFEAARAHALRVAEGRGDTRSVEAIRRQEPAIDVLDPDALRLVAAARESEDVKQLRRTFQDAASAYAAGDYTDPDAEQAAWDSLVEARSALAALTDDLNGRGAERRPYEDGRGDWW